VCLPWFGPITTLSSVLAMWSRRVAQSGNRMDACESRIRLGRLGGASRSPLLPASDHLLEIVPCRFQAFDLLMHRSGSA